MGCALGPLESNWESIFVVWGSVYDEYSAVVLVSDSRLVECDVQLRSVSLCLY